MKFSDIASLKDVCEIKTNFQNADFWIIRRGSEDSVGKPVKVFNKEHIGIKVLYREIILPEYLYYWFMALHNKGVFKQICHGTLKLVNIKISDIASIPIALPSSTEEEI